MGADWRDVVPGTNATSLVNAVIASLALAPGDLLLMSNATYPAVSGDCDMCGDCLCSQSMQLFRRCA